MISLLLASFLIVFYVETKDNPIFYEYLWQRTEWDDSSNTIEGNNRSNESVDAYLKNARGSIEYYIGTSDSNWYDTVAGGSSATYKSIIGIHGIIFFILYTGFFIMLDLNKKNKLEALLYCVVVLANFYQRSSIYFPVTMFLYCAYAMDYYIDISNRKVNKGHFVSFPKTG